MDVLLTTAASGAGRRESTVLATANAVLSVLAADYPAGSLACYVSDDGADILAFEVLFEVAGFARRWVPFCRRHGVEPRAPELYFARGVDYLRDRAAPSFVKERRAMKVTDRRPIALRRFKGLTLMVIGWVAERVRGVQGEDQLPRREGEEGAGGRVGHVRRHAMAGEQPERPSCHDTGDKALLLDPPVTILQQDMAVKSYVAPFDEVRFMHGPPGSSGASRRPGRRGERAAPAVLRVAGEEAGVPAPRESRRPERPGTRLISSTSIVYLVADLCSSAAICNAFLFCVAHW